MKSHGTAKYVFVLIRDFIFCRPVYYNYNSPESFKNLVNYLSTSFGKFAHISLENYRKLIEKKYINYSYRGIIARIEKYIGMI